MWQCGKSHGCFTASKIIKAMYKSQIRSVLGGFWLVLLWFAENIWITAVVTSPCCQTSSDIGELFLNGLLWVVSVRVLKARSFLNLFSALKKNVKDVGEKEMLVKKIYNVAISKWSLKKWIGTVLCLRLEKVCLFFTSFFRYEGDELTESNEWRQL